MNPPIRAVARRRLVPWILLAVLAQAACAGSRSGGSPPAAPEAQVSERLFFGRSIPGGGSVSEEEWGAFLRDVITPRFPRGLTVWRAEGQWLEAQGVLAREPVVVVEFVHRAGPDLERALEEISAEYKRRFRQEAVLRVSSVVRQRLYEE